jgi:hypothetical protein
MFDVCFKNMLILLGWRVWSGFLSWVMECEGF